MKFTTIIGTAIATVALAACGSATGSPAVSPTIAPTVAPTSVPTATPTPAPAVTVTVTCSNVWKFATAYPPGSKLGKATWHGVSVGDSLNFGDSPLMYPITSNPFSTGTEGFGDVDDAFTQGTWVWAEWGPDQTTQITHGTLTIPACPGTTIR